MDEYDLGGKASIFYGQKFCSDIIFVTGNNTQYTIYTTIHTVNHPTSTLMHIKLTFEGFAVAIFPGRDIDDDSDGAGDEGLVETAIIMLQIRYKKINNICSQDRNAVSNNNALA